MSQRRNEQDILDCILDDYASRDYVNPGTELRKALRRSATNYQQIMQSGRVLTIEDALKNPRKCANEYIDGVNLFPDKRSVKSSPLYLLADTLKRAKESPVFSESRIKRGQTRESHTNRTTQARERKNVQKQEGKQRDSMWQQFTKTFAPGNWGQEPDWQR